jgi:hypothetical protein
VAEKKLQIRKYIDIGAFNGFQGWCEGYAGRRENGNAFSGGKLGLFGRGVKNQK